jgi:hypothetical protein
VHKKTYAFEDALKLIPAGEIEYHTKQRDSHVIYGLLIRRAKD